ncbi:FAD-binding oxidoreductase [Streptomyces hoynatensis]|uniref:FAD-binding oxidoreductase n=2 Tax=Streptomyces hoynatensis TaxID=1141874 RepID=A0A3A9YSP1_9ACTN|nr:FAD-binding oxidoreductase [Streptomyces hoynatensis]
MLPEPELRRLTELVPGDTPAGAAAAGTPGAATPGIEEFCREAEALLGPEGVLREEAVLDRCSRDWAHMSPILAARLPAGRAEVVLRPTGHDRLPALLSLAYRHRVPITPRGKGTGNYGQAIPLRGGAVLDLTGCNRVAEVGEGWIRAEAGAKMSDLEARARAAGQELWMFPSTFGTSLGGFLAGGSGGTGSLRHGTNGDGFVRELRIVPCTREAAPFTVTGAGALPYIHAYGTSGVIATATVRLAPARLWTGLFAAFGAWAPATAALAELVRLEPAPRLVSLDEPALVRTFGADPALDRDAHSLRAIVEEEAAPAARALVERHGGRVLDTRPAPEGPALISSLSFNHPTYHLMKAEEGWFHLEVAGDVLLGDTSAVKAVYPGTVLHLEGMRSGTVGMLMARYRDEPTVRRGIEALEELGVRVHDVHQWYVDRRVELVREAAARTDPRGLLNPGHLRAG